MPEIVLIHGSLVEQDVDYIVNAANTMMRGGGGIDGLIHRLAGPKLLLELQRVAPRGCATGEVVVTGAHDLKHRGIIHTPGPIWRGGGQSEDLLLANSYRNSLDAVSELGATSIGFCSISTGSYRFPLELAAPIAIGETRKWIAKKPETSLSKIVFVLHRQQEFDAFEAALHAT
jgi:O-acetyl-ADP-ribose deacetylase (regulator of RNase III)